MTFTLLSLVILGITAAIIYKHACLAYKRGLTASLIHLSIIIFSAVFAALISGLIATLSGGAFFSYICKLLSIEESGIGLFSSALEIIVKMLFSVVIYLPVFFLLKALVNFIAKRVIGAVNRRRRNGQMTYCSEDEVYHVKHEKKLAMAIGIISGFMMSVIVFMPLTGTLKSANDIVHIVSDMTDNSKIKESEGVQLLDKYANDFSGTVLNTCGGQVIYDLASRTSVEGQSTYLNNEIRIISSIDIMETKDKLGESNGGMSENIEEIEQIVDKMEESLVLKVFMVDVLKDASTKWMENTSYYGIPKPVLGDSRALDDFMDSILYVCSTTTMETCDADISTVINIMKIFGDYDALVENASYEAIMTEFVENDGLGRIEDELYKNPHMSSVHMAIDNLLIELIAQEITEIKYSNEIRDRLYKGIAASLNDTRGLTGSVKMSALSNGISEEFEKSGVIIPDNINDKLANIIYQNIASQNGSIHENDVKKFFEEFDKSNEE